MSRTQPFQLIRAKERKVKRWSGGTTEELFIAPDSASYAKMNFDLRVSRATVEVETSTFTPLPHVNRTTLILEGEMELTHDGEYTKTIGKFEQDSYDGGWKTTSVGTCADFNLMTRGSTTGTVDAHTLEKDEQLVCSKADKRIVYVHSGRAAVVVNHQAQILEQGDLFAVEQSALLIIVKAMEEAELIIVHATKVEA